MNDATPILDIKDFHLAFEGYEGLTRVLNGIDLSIAEGESVGIVGETGCGKSVLARSILRLNPSPPARLSGAIQFAGRDVLRMDSAELHALRGNAIGMVFQDPATYLNPVFTIGSQLAEVLRAHGWRGRGKIISRSLELLQAVQLGDPALLGRYPHQLSGGMRQRVLIAQALAGNPRLLIADEPTTALDVTIQREVLALIASLVSRLRLTLMLISHDLGVIGAICRRIVVMYAGVIVEDAPAQALFTEPLHPYTRGLLAAVPDLQRPDQLPRGIPGAIPSLRTPPPGCRFHPRCPLAMPICRTEAPRLMGAAHRTACHAVAA